MFFCKECAIKNNWYTYGYFSYDKCEICGKETECYNIPKNELISIKEKSQGLYNSCKWNNTCNDNLNCIKCEVWYKKTFDK